MAVILLLYGAAFSCALNDDCSGFGVVVFPFFLLIYFSMTLNSFIVFRGRYVQFCITYCKYGYILISLRIYFTVMNFYSMAVYFSLIICMLLSLLYFKYTSMYCNVTIAVLSVNFSKLWWSTC